MTPSEREWLPGRVLAGIFAIPSSVFALMILARYARGSFDWLSLIILAASMALAFLCGWIAAAAHLPSSRKRIACALVGGAGIGGPSFAAGFFGPMFLSPESNQGPMLGIFITGPVGFTVGVVAGTIYGVIRFRTPA